MLLRDRDIRILIVKIRKYDIGGMGYQFSMFYDLHNVEMMYAIMLVIGFTGLFIDRVLIKYAENLVKKIGSGREIAFGNHQ